jgi:hypothetical protein
MAISSHLRSLADRKTHIFSVLSSGLSPHAPSTGLLSPLPAQTALTGIGSQPSKRAARGRVGVMPLGSSSGSLVTRVWRWPTAAATGSRSWSRPTSAGMMRRACGSWLARGCSRRGAAARACSPHAYRAQLVGLSTRTFTGWLEVSPGGDAVYAPHLQGLRGHRRARTCCWSPTGCWRSSASGKPTAGAQPNGCNSWPLRRPAQHLARNQQACQNSQNDEGADPRPMRWGEAPGKGRSHQILDKAHRTPLREARPESEREWRYVDQEGLRAPARLWVDPCAALSRARLADPRRRGRLHHGAAAGDTVHQGR